jgi:hypothetical protein
MTDTSESAAVDLPRVYLIRMMVFTILVAIVGAILYPQFAMRSWPIRGSTG